MEATNNFRQSPSKGDLNNSPCNKPQDFHVPIAKSFSFSIPEIWRPTNPTLLRWIDNLPIPAKKEEPLEPASIQTPKRTFAAVDTDMAHDDNSHRNKRARVSSFRERSAAEEHRSKLAKSGHKLARSVSNVCRRAISAIQPPDELSDEATVCESPSLPGTPSTVVDRPRMRFVFVGDSGCGKSTMLLRFYRDVFTKSYAPTQYELFSKTIMVDGLDVDVELWDTCGNIDLHQLQLLSYLVWDAVFLCFSVTDDETFDSARTKWI
ncbi:P-loop containing nucleoside triphosphate hydrolase protein [Durotheca rogersii]|uniref:P-loop containing nucleoside triphosphate hydrolase protein n=1 Tax=Durotheca rogersii TaxID=419775 RepID=UPI00221FD568|nr:P-loop containing nucleoside triphosphate hydrolase protein [Durotheca rogersii]KAI5865427.1 P-loop containing nucleoside triphosphate hydrolase protein [Durotheca rogersii]